MSYTYAMAHSLDPHQLAALMSVTIPYDKNAPLPRPDIHEQNVVNQIVHDPDADYSIFPELDALAGICISKPDLHQAVALAVQLCPREKEIRLTVAGSGEIHDKLPEYLSSVWARLAMISRMCATQRAPKTPHPVQGTLPTSSESDSTITEYGCRVAMFREVYLFGLAKHISRMKKYSTGLGSFVQQLRKRRGRRVELQGLENKILNCYAATLGAIKWFEKCAHSQIPILDHEWDYAYSVMNLMVENCLPVLADEVTCENLVRELQDPSCDTTFPLRSALEKLSRLHRHFLTLVSYAQSPRRQFVFRHEFSVAMVPTPPHRVVQLPSSSAEWESLINQLRACDGREHEQGERLAQLFAHQHYNCPIHCECALIAHLDSQRCRRTSGSEGDGGHQWDIPPFNYIGLSRLTCATCACWIDSYCILGRGWFYHRGSSKKWSWPWGFLDMKCESLAVHMTNDVILYCEDENERGRPKPPRPESFLYAQEGMGSRACDEGYVLGTLSIWEEAVFESSESFNP